MRNVRRTVAVGLVVAGVALTQHACTTADPSPAPPAPSAAAPTAVPGFRGSFGPPGAAADGGPAAILGGRRQVTIKLVEDPDGVLAVGAGGRLDVSDAEPSLFVLQPTGDSFRIRTGATGGGESSCLTITPDGSKPLTVVATACEAGNRTQVFSLRAVSTDREGRPTFSISSDGVFLQWFRNGTEGLIAQEAGDAPVDTRFTFLDGGANALPTAGG